MDLFKRRRGEWVKKIQSGAPENVGAGGEKSKSFKAGVKGGKLGRGAAKNAHKTTGAARKTAIEIARERFAEGKRAKENGTEEWTVDSKSNGRKGIREKRSKIESITA